MSNRRDIPYLLSLLDDNSPVVRKHVSVALLEFGRSLEREVAHFRTDLNEEQLSVLDELCSDIRQASGNPSWMEWLNMEDPHQALEFALIQLSVLEYGPQGQMITSELDELATRFKHESHEVSASTLMEFLFVDNSFSSPREERFSHLHDNLMYVLQRGQGSQLGLSCLAILTAHRVGIELYGIRIQGNFMPVFFENHNLELFNAFDRGKPLARASIMYIEEAIRRNEMSPWKMKSEVYEIVLQVIKNCISSHRKLENVREAQDYVQMYKSLTSELNARNLPY